MYKVLIVDDEVFVRMGLKASVEWQMNGFELVGEAGNGLQALEMMEINRPDIVITDIKMPVMDGISLIKEITARYPTVKCLVLSNYDDFELVREAMRHGAADYFLKVTVEPDKFVEVLKEICGKIQKEIDKIQSNTEIKWVLNKNQFLIRNQFILDLLKSDFSENVLVEKAAALKLRLNSNKGFAVLIVVRQYENELRLRFGGDSNLLTYAINNLIEELLNHDFSGEIFELKQGCFVALASIDRLVPEEKERMLAEQIRDAMGDYLGISVNVFHGLNYDSYVELRKMLQNSQGIEVLGFYEEDGSVISGKRYLFSQESLNDLYTELKRELGVFIKFCDYNKVSDCIRNFLLQAKSRKCKPDMLKGVLISIYNYLREEIEKNDPGFTGMDIVEELQHCSSFEQLSGLFGSMVDKLIFKIGDADGEKLKEVVLKAVEYIEKNYAGKIVLEDIAKYVSMNKSYFSRYFKKEMGVPFQDYLTRVRMEKAAELILKTDKKIIEIAFEVGFSDIFYFNRVFKKFYDTSPSEYKKKMQRK